MAVVDSLIAVQAQAPAAAGAAPVGTSTDGSFSIAAAVGKTGGWVAVAPGQGAYYSASVVDLFFHLEVSCTCIEPLAHWGWCCCVLVLVAM
jgi:hypothetical protein